MSNIMASPYKHPQTGVYYFRMAVPKKLVPVIGKTVFKKSLQTKNLSEAKHRFPQHLDDALKQIDFAKLKLSNSSNVELNVRDCAIIAERWYLRVKDEVDGNGNYDCYLRYEWYGVEGDKRLHVFGLSDTFEFSGLDASKATEEEYQELLQGFKDFIEEQLKIEGLVVCETSASYRRLVCAFYDYARRVESLCLARHKRDFGYEPVTSSIASEPISVSKPDKIPSRVLKPSQNSISSLLKRYLESASINGKASQSLAEVESQIERLIEIIGDIDVADVTRGHISKYKDTLLQLPKSKAKEIRNKSVPEQLELVKTKGLETIAPSTVKTILRKTSPVFGYAVELGLIDVNPYKGVTLPKVQNKSAVAEAKGFSPREINQLFQFDIFTDATANKPYGMACYWVPLLCRYTGSRIEEMVQLRRSDIQLSDECIHFIYVREGEEQNVKNVKSVRQVPIHDHLIDLGFLDYVASCGEFLFPEHKPNKHGKRSGAIGKWWSKQVKTLGITKQPSHSFRHSLRTALRGLGVVDSVSDAITGHAPANIGAAYGTVDMKAKKKAIDCLPRLAVPRIW
ncbi:TPA: site-specific integrase [Vibrio parahaemolyticus]|uniref:site-specific integrase n=1 Tax=Vibrio parahaemolyticus TaxID=670 RepID=UPI00111DDBBF|nr:site-specific integrase [Vibrio parahaemolyticus]TOP93715.1 integrase [Vibrio parahaemolyticus]HBC3446793.1 site-specific integrase [Vibrio parahaemolyticus]HCZ9547492.1 site-specific integrase [Vibrio alginolyticus]